ncbi:MAG: ATPase, partial [Terriglobia bacterium]
MRLFLGVDGGQSGTKTLIGDESGRVIGAGRAGPCNHGAAAEGRAKLVRAITDSVGAACGNAGISLPVHFTCACCGMSGGPADKEAILRELVDAERLIVTTDADVALAGATESGQGIIVIAGTGSIALGRNSQGVRVRAGGWGYIFGDEGSAFDIARQALRAALRMEEGWGPATALRDILLEATGSKDVNDALHRFYSPDWPRDRVAGLAPLVDEAAGAGDTAAIEILNYSALQLATLATSVRAQLWKPASEVVVAYSGGVFGSGNLRERF